MKLSDHEHCQLGSPAMENQGQAELWESEAMNQKENYTVDNRLRASETKKSAQKRERWYYFSYFLQKTWLYFLKFDFKLI